MTDPGRLAIIRGVHTAIYVVMAAAILAIVYAGISGARGPWLWAALALAMVEVAVFVGGGLKCPLTAVAARYDPQAGATSDTYFPARVTRHTATVFGPLLAAGLVMLALRWGFDIW